MMLLLYPLQWLALAGLLCAFLLHLLAMWNMPLPAVLAPYVDEALVDGVVGVLGMGVFVVWLPTVLVASRVQGAYRVTGMSWKVLLAGCPPWMRKASMGLFVYAFANFFLAIATEQPVTGEDHALSGMRAFTGHWMLFYGMAYAAMYSVTHRPQLLQARNCVAGHAVGYSDQFCPTCGQPMPRDE